MDNNADYYSTDKSTILLLLTNKLPIEHSEKDEHGKTRFYFKREHAEKLVFQYQRGELPRYDFEAFIAALSLFNSIVHARG